MRQLLDEARKRRGAKADEACREANQFVDDSFDKIEKS